MHFIEDVRSTKVILMPFHFPMSGCCTLDELLRSCGETNKLWKSTYGHNEPFLLSLAPIYPSYPICLRVQFPSSVFSFQLFHHSLSALLILPSGPSLSYPLSVVPEHFSPSGYKTFSIIFLSKLNIRSTPIELWIERGGVIPLSPISSLCQSAIAMPIQMGFMPSLLSLVDGGGGISPPPSS